MGRQERRACIASAMPRLLNAVCTVDRAFGSRTVPSRRFVSWRLIWTRDSCCSLTSNAERLDRIRPALSPGMMPNAGAPRLEADIPMHHSSGRRPSLVPDGMSSSPRGILQPSQENKNDRHGGICGGNRHFAEVDCGPTNRTDHGEYPFDSPGQRSGLGHSHTVRHAGNGMTLVRDSTPLLALSRLSPDP